MGSSTYCNKAFLYSILLALLTCVYAGDETTDMEALLEFKAKITSDPFGVLSSWNDSIHACQWHGVVCGHRHTRVTVLNLQSSELSGHLSPHIGNLSFLRELQLQNNTFIGGIPPEIGRLQSLEILRLFNNSFSGNIPSNISGCSNLRSISIAGNQLEGEIPVKFGYLSKLNFVTMTQNRLSGPIPLSFGNLTSLEELSLTENMFTSLPDTLGQLRNLTYCALGENNLSGTVPPGVFNLSKLTFFSIVYNQIHGPLPSDLFLTLPNIEYFGVAMNQITGPLPASISNATTLQRIQTTQNRLTGKIPSLEKLGKLRWFHVSSNLHGSGRNGDLDFLCSLTNATNLERVGMNNNNVGGTIPECLGNLSSSLKILIWNRNVISGRIPTGIGNLVGLVAVDMGNNQLSGNIPPDIGKLEKLVLLYFDGNKLSGNIPHSVGNLKQLTELYLRSNSLEGKIPSSLGECQRLVQLDLSVNDLTGRIPSEIFFLSSLSIYLDLSWNNLTGPLPMEVGNLKNLGILDFSENMFSQGIPSSIGSCTKLQILNMQGNFFEGSIPMSLSLLRGIEQLDLSRNNLSGQIPDFFQGFEFFRKLNLSYNNLEGSVPTVGVFSNVSKFSIAGNSELCGGLPELFLPRCDDKVHRDRSFSVAKKAIIAAVSCLVGVLFLVVCFVVFLRLRKKGEIGQIDVFEDFLLKLSYQDLLKATDDFSSANLIGVGSSGKVYKGNLEKTGSTVAVKVFDLQRFHASKSFLAECEVLKNIRHRNLVRVVTACSSTDFSGNEFKAIVYEFMPNGSLEEWLYLPQKSDDSNEIQKSLSLLQRLNIAIDIACSLDYLHHHCETPIVHCDLKPSNVLLDNEMNGHLGDFGLSKIQLEASHTSVSIETTSIGIRGSVGYTAPEYGMGMEVSTYGDVYSYGILLLEMFTGMRPTDTKFEGSFYLHQFVRRALAKEVKRIIDPTILQEIEQETYSKYTSSQNNQTNSRFYECLVAIFETGIACSTELPRERTDISDALTELHSIREKFLISG